uniref:Reverse transcriptase domain-containing protein n=1 Tax=Ananas comosus var. bracteatus TaxID=296719 RepID=A0A6V7P239_ANACO|nr:unnamed protein product [Ananas comosus var. bracteatus]
MEALAVLRQRHDQTVQDYTTDFWRQALALGISLNDPQVFRKYTAGLQERINDELHLFDVRDIASASQTAMAIERKNKLSRGEKPTRETCQGSMLEVPSRDETKEEDNRGKGTTTTATTSARSTSDAPTLIGRIDQANTSVSLMAMPKETSLYFYAIDERRSIPFLDDFVIVYLDDILIYSQSWEEYLVHVKKVFMLLEKHKLRLNRKKCEYSKQSLVYLGFMVDDSKL